MGRTLRKIRGLERLISWGGLKDGISTWGGWVRKAIMVLVVVIPSIATWLLSNPYMALVVLVVVCMVVGVIGPPIVDAVFARIRDKKRARGLYSRPGKDRKQIFLWVKAERETDDFKVSLLVPPILPPMQWTEGGRDFRTIVKGMVGVVELCEVRFSTGGHPTFDIRYRVPDAEWLQHYLYLDENGREYRVTVPIRVAVQSRSRGIQVHEVALEAEWLVGDEVIEARLVCKNSRNQRLWGLAYEKGFWGCEAPTLRRV